MAGDQPQVTGVVALNPWVHPEDRVDLTGRTVLVVHGTEDRVADPRRSVAMTERLARTTVAGYLRVTEGQHAMLRHRSAFEDAATDFVRATLLGADVTGPVADLLDGAGVVTV